MYQFLTPDNIVEVFKTSRQYREPDDGDAEGESWKEGHEVLPELDAIETELNDEAFSDYLDEESEREAHPLQTLAHDFVLRLLTEIEKERSESTAQSDGNTPLDRFIRNSMKGLLFDHRGGGE